MQERGVPGPRSSRIAQGVALFRNPLALLDRCARDYGDCFRLRVFGFPDIAFLSDPDAIREIFAKDGTDAIDSGSIFASQIAPVIGEHSMLIIDGEEHRRHRGITMPYFARGQFARFGEAILEMAQREVASWPTGTSFPIRPRMQSITLKVILRIIFGEHSASVFKPDLLLRSFGRGPNPFVFYSWARVDLGPRSPWGGFVRIRRELTAGIIAEMERRRSAAERVEGDVLAAMMDARGETGAALSEQELIDEIWTLINAGNDTTATALAWAIYYIVSNPEVLVELRREIGIDGERSADQIAQLPYLDATVKEVMRIAPIFLFVLRRLTQPMRVGTRELPAGTLVAPCIYLAHRRPDVWEEPERFNPRRFLDRRDPAHNFFPFGGGIRYCIGAALATYEMKLVLAQVLIDADLKIAPGYVAKPKWLANFIGPSKDLPVACERHRANQSVDTDGATRATM